MTLTLETIKSDEFVQKILFARSIKIVVFIFCVFLFTFISYGRAFDYFFWRDDTKVVWMQRYVPAQINNFGTLGTARGRIGSVIFDYLEYTFLGFDSLPHQIFGFALRLVNVFLVFFLAHVLTKSKRVSIVTALFAASFIGGLESYSWVRGIGFMITLSLTALILYLKSYQKKSKFLFILSACFVAGAFSMDLWRSMGVVLIILLWEILSIYSKTPEISRKH